MHFFVIKLKDDFLFFFCTFFFFFCNFLVIFWYIIVKKCHFQTQNAKNSDCFWIENFISYNIKRNNFSDIEGPMNFVFKLHNLLTPVLNIVIFLSIFVSSFLKHVLKIRVKVNNHTWKKGIKLVFLLKNMTYKLLVLHLCKKLPSPGKDIFLKKIIVQIVSSKWCAETFFWNKSISRYWTFGCFTISKNYPLQ